MLSWLKPSPLLTESEQQWLLDAFLWAFEHFDADYFRNHSRLVQPSNEFFQGQSSSTEQMAAQVFAQVKAHSGLQNWPIQLLGSGQMPEQQFPLMRFSGALRGEQAHCVEHSHAIFVSYNPQQINQPQDLIASYAQAFARIMIYQRGVLPPGGEAMIGAATEVVASFFGFGVMLSNTVYQFRGGCGKCYNPYANRASELSEQQHVFLLALFCFIKGEKQGTAHLKGHLRSYYKKAHKIISTLANHSPNPMLLSLLSKEQV
ncbi:hypothetical protein MHM89_08275 [Pseudoalteromonas sp. CNC9-20]|uniref:hypothetical protein n=1 Tax=Pseudoalteromonas sp. CNC9-20 TaxID=2917750 RepID=UPI001EF51B79|nr:hypothetical protein [Pseudoalteromonas sp. CNC9-20]MCG7569922.1 hypothetical protein [Pseudoalteromonas sp. CNC9-20]